MLRTVSGERRLVALEAVTTPARTSVVLSGDILLTPDGTTRHVEAGVAVGTVAGTTVTFNTSFASADDYLPSVLYAESADGSHRVGVKLDRRADGLTIYTDEEGAFVWWKAEDLYE